MDPLLGAVLSGVGVVLGAIVAAVQKSRSEAVIAAEKAVSTVSTALEVQGTQVENLSTTVATQGTLIADLNTRVTDVTKRHAVAIDHIAEREDAAEENLGANRPVWLPTIPDLIRPDVDAARRPR